MKRTIRNTIISYDTFESDHSLKSAIQNKGSEKVIYKHALAQYPYFRDFTAKMGIFSPTGLEYIAANMKDLVGEVTLIDLRYEKEYRDIKILFDFIKKEIGLGLSYRENGKYIHNGNRSIPDTLIVAFPDRSLRKHDYHWIQNGAQIVRFTFDTVLTSRGCPYNCKFCTFSLNPLGQKRKYTERPLDSVIEELKSVTAEVILFSDDNFFTNPKRSEKLCELISENGINKTFIVRTRIEIARHEGLLEKAQRAGFKILLIGIESPHDRILEQLGKGFTRQQVRDAFIKLPKIQFGLAKREFEKKGWLSAH
jgi:radical SAM superfamily enzyme YgiQ (UPF0313 family)